MRVLAIHPFAGGASPDPTPGTRATYPVLSVGLIGLLNQLRAAGVDARALHLPLAHTADPSFSLAAWLDSRPPAQIVLLPLHWYEHAAGVADTAAIVGTHWPQSVILVGGLTATHFADELLARWPQVHGVICGDAEPAMAALATHLGRDRPGLPPNVPNLHTRGAAPSPRMLADDPALDCLDTVSLDFLDDPVGYRRLLHSRPIGLPPGDWRGHWLANGRGCAFQCAYCGGTKDAHRALFGAPAVRRRDPVQLANDVARLQRAGVHQVSLTLDPDMLGARHQDAFFGALPADPTGFYVESFQLPSARLLNHLDAHADLPHTEIALTPLSGDADVRRDNGKRYSDAALHHSLDAIGQRGMAAFVFFSANLPGETEAAMAQTIALARRVLSAPHAHRVRVMNICHTRDPRSPAARDPRRHGLTPGPPQTLGHFEALGRSPRPWTFQGDGRGFDQPGRDLRAMVAMWDAFCEDHPGRAIPVPRL